MKEDGEEKDMSEDDREEKEIEDAETRMIYNPVTKTVDMRKYRATDAPMNATLKLPPGQTPEYEAGLDIRRQKWMDTVEKFIAANCDDKGRQVDNLTESQRRGIRKLQKRITAGELLVCPTDKSGRLAVLPLEMYAAAGEVHTSKDKEVDMEYAAKKQRLVQGHTSAWLKILNVGEDHKHEDRHRSTFIIK